MKRLYLDESGECSFSDSSTYQHFLITIISIENSENYKIKNHLQRNFRKFIKSGWDKSVEFKAFDLYRNRKFGVDAIIKLLQSLININSLEINYLVVNKNRITNQSFRNSSYGIGYNYFTGVLLEELVFIDNHNDIYLIYDLRNKETHHRKHFKEYLETKILGTALEKNTTVNMKIEGLESEKCYGLLAVDLLSWAIFRRFEHSDERFFKMISGKINRKREWYI